MLALALIVATAVCPAVAQVDLGLTPAAQQGTGPYRNASLSVRNRSGQIVRAVAIRMIPQGGPTFVMPVTVPPDANYSTDILLPVLVPAQSYEVRALADDRPDAALVASRIVDTTWPAAMVSQVAFIDGPAYGQYEDSVPTWPASLIRSIFIAAAATCLALAATLFMRRTILRLAAVVVMLIASTIGMLWLAAGAEVVVSHYEYSETNSGMGHNSLVPSLLVVACRRSTVWNNPSRDLVPIYYSPWHMKHDSTVIDQRGLTVPMTPGQVRLFRVLPTAAGH
jgi:hypothetical protein